jgi:hypothetical protein
MTDLPRLLAEQRAAADAWRALGSHLLPLDQPTPLTDSQCAWIGVCDWLAEEVIERKEGEIL